MIRDAIERELQKIESDLGDAEKHIRKYIKIAGRMDDIDQVVSLAEIAIKTNMRRQQLNVMAFVLKLLLEEEEG